MRNLPINLNIDNDIVAHRKQGVMNLSWRTRGATIQQRNEKVLSRRPNPAL